MHWWMLAHGGLEDELHFLADSPMAGWFALGSIALVLVALSATAIYQIYRGFRQRDGGAGLP